MNADIPFHEVVGQLVQLETSGWDRARMWFYEVPRWIVTVLVLGNVVRLALTFGDLVLLAFVPLWAITLYYSTYVLLVGHDADGLFVETWRGTVTKLRYADLAGVRRQTAFVPSHWVVITPKPWLTSRRRYTYVRDPDALLRALSERGVQTPWREENEYVQGPDDDTPFEERA